MIDFAEKPLFSLILLANIVPSDIFKNLKQSKLCSTELTLLLQQFTHFSKISSRLSKTPIILLLFLTLHILPLKNKTYINPPKWLTPNPILQAYSSHAMSLPKHSKFFDLSSWPFSLPYSF